MTDFFDGKKFLKTVPSRPGVYTMYGKDDLCLYVGKARNLKNRVGSYFRNTGLTTKTMVMVSKIERMDVQITRSDNEALLLEYNLIQSLKPRYNIMMRDDKSYPYIRLTDEAFPRLTFYRGSTRRSGQFFGPYPNAGAVRETLNQIHKIIPLRQCKDSVFKNRTRPCLQHQIGRCSAPCTTEISREAYLEDINQARLLLSGDDTTLDKELNQKMELFAAELRFEEAARFRDRIRQLRMVKAGQFVAQLSGDVDVIALAREGLTFCVSILTVRDGMNLGQKNIISSSSRETEDNEILGAFLSQHYMRQKPPSELILPTEPVDSDILANALSQISGYKVQIKSVVRGKRDRWLQMAQLNAKEYLARHLQDEGNNLKKLEELSSLLELDSIPERIECFDISHTMGERTVASCVVFDQQGPVNGEYRRFNIKQDTRGDDYAAMGEALDRRYRRVLEGEGQMPDLLLVDGGIGQFNRARKVLDELGLSELRIVGVAKGLERRSGQERLFLSRSEQPTILDHLSGASHLIQAIRDEAHRFAITGHRARRQKARTVSKLEQIEGIGAVKRRALLNHFGGLRQVTQASLEELLNVPGINRKLADKLFVELKN